MVARIDRGEVVALFQGIRASFPALTVDFDSGRQNEHADVEMNVPFQAGLDFGVTLQLQGDELHLLAGAFWLEWFPCTDARVVANYREAVVGLLSGRYRIVESYLGGAVVAARLQRPTLRGWRTIGRWSCLWALIPWRTSSVILKAGEGAAG